MNTMMLPYIVYYTETSAPSTIYETVEKKMAIVMASDKSKAIEKVDLVLSNIPTQGCVIDYSNFKAVLFNPDNVMVADKDSTMLYDIF